MNDSYSIQAAWNDGNSFTAPLPATYGTLYALAPVNEVYELQSAGPATSLDEIQVRNDVGEPIAITCLLNGAPVVVQPVVAHGQMAVFSIHPAPPTPILPESPTPVRVEYVNATDDDTFDSVLVFQQDLKPSFSAIAVAWMIIEHVPPGGGSDFSSPRIPLYFGLVREIVESDVLQSATLSTSFTKVDLTGAGDTATVKLTGSADSGYAFELVTASR
jgi:hypothetical protein